MDTKIENIHIRISEKEKELITKYCKANKIHVSDFIRETCMKQISSEGEK